MTTQFRKFMLSCTAVLALASVGCGSDKASPLGPSALPKMPQADLHTAGETGVGASGFSSAHKSSEVEFKGVVESITPPDLKVAGVTVHTDAGTEVKRNDRKIALTDLKTGDIVKVEGVLLGDGTVLAHEIEAADDSVEFEGKVDSVSPPDLKVNGVTVHTDAKTRITRDDRPIGLTDIKVGESAEVSGGLLSDGTVLARRIKVGENEDDDEVEFKGAVESISPPTLTVAGIKVSTDESTKIERDDNRIALTDLKVGEIVKVEGVLLPDGSVLAHEIEAGEDEEDVEFRGTIQTISPPGLTVNGIKVVTDGNTKITKDCKQVALSDLKVGETVKVEGVLLPDGTVLARKIKAGKCDKNGDDDDDDDDDDDEGDDEGEGD